MSRISATNCADGPGSSDPDKKDASPRGLRAELWDWMVSFTVALVIAIAIHQYGFLLSTVKGQSMEPTLIENEWLFVNKFVYVFGNPRPGEVVILKDPELRRGERHYLVKRVIAVPGDKVEARGHRLYLNDRPVNEVYTDTNIEDADFGPLVVGPDQYFVMGDNRHLGRSNDSRYFGTVPSRLIEGRAEFIIWPVSRWKKLTED